MANEEEELPKLREYQPYWNMLKEYGAVKLNLNEAQLEDVSDYIRRIKKAISKEKYMDNNFRLQYPFAKIKVTYYEEGNHVIFKLEGYYKSSDILGEAND